MPGQLAERRDDVESGDGFGDQGRRDARSRDHQRHAGRAFEEAHLEPQAALAQHVAMVGGEQDDRVVQHPRVGQHLQEFAELVVDIADIGEIALPRAADVLAA